MSGAARSDGSLEHMSIPYSDHLEVEEEAYQVFTIQPQPADHLRGRVPHLAAGNELFVHCSVQCVRSNRLRLHSSHTLDSWRELGAVHWLDCLCSAIRFEICRFGIPFQAGSQADPSIASRRGSSHEDPDPETGYWAEVSYASGLDSSCCHHCRSVKVHWVGVNYASGWDSSCCSGHSKIGCSAGVSPASGFGCGCCLALERGLDTGYCRCLSTVG